MGNQKSVKPLEVEQDAALENSGTSDDDPAHRAPGTFETNDQVKSPAQENSKPEAQTKQRLVARESGILKLKAMGFDEAMAQQALVRAENDKEAAVNALLDQEQSGPTVPSTSPSSSPPTPELFQSKSSNTETEAHLNSDLDPAIPQDPTVIVPMETEAGAVGPTTKSSSKLQAELEGFPVAKSQAATGSPEASQRADDDALLEKEPVQLEKEPVRADSRGLPLSVVFMEKLHKVFHHKQVKYLKSYGYSRHEAVEALKAQGQGGDVKQALRFLMERGLPEEIQFIKREAYDQRLLEHLETAGHASPEQMDYDKCQLKRKASLEYCGVHSKGSSGSIVEPSQQALLKKRLTRLGLEERLIVGDGNCQFRALSQELFGNQSHHQQIRTLAVQHIAMHEKEFLLLFASGSEFRSYQKQMKLDKTWGDELTLRACADALNVSIHVLTSSQGNTGYYLVYMPRSGQPLRRCFLTYLCPFHYNVLSLPETTAGAGTTSKPLPPVPVERLTNMGFEQDQAMAVTAVCGNDENAAIDTLLTAQEVAQIEAAEKAEGSHAIERQLSGVRKLGEMGFNQSQAALALVEAGNDKEKAVHVLLDAESKRQSALNGLSSEEKEMNSSRSRLR